MWRQIKRGTLNAYLIVGALFGVAGVVLLTTSHAATPSQGQEAEGGTLSSCVSSVSDTTASSGAGVKFGACTTVDPGTLDTTGATIPDTNYAIPAGAIFMATTGSDSNAGTQAAPVKTLNKAITLATSGGTIVIRAGTYHDWYNNGTTYASLSKTLTFQPYPHEQVWFDGTDVQPTANWTSDGTGQWYMSWSTPSFCNGHYYDFAYNNQSSPTNTTSSTGSTYGTNNGPCAYYDTYGDPNDPAAGDPQMVYKDGTYVHEDVCPGDISTLSASDFCYQEDLANQTGRMYLGFNPSGHTVELASRSMVMMIGASNVTVRGLGFTRYATNSFSNTTQAAFYVGASGSTFENDVFKDMAGEGLAGGGSGGDVHVVHSAFVNNGYRGLSVNGHQHSTGAPDGSIVENSLFTGNNREIFDTGCSASCGAAAIKMAHMDGFTLRNNILENTQGNSKGIGFWCDLACSNGVMVYNLVRNNNHDGIMYEVSDTGIIASNMVYDNGGYGIRVASANTKIYNNTVVDNTGSGGIWVYDDSRSYNYGGFTDVGPDTVNVSFANNIVADTKNSNTILRAQGSGTGQTNTQPSQFFTSPATFDYNAYWRTASTQNLMRWIPYGVTETDYKSLSSWQGAGFDTHSTEQSAGSDPFFTNMTGNDYTVRSDSSAYHSGTTIPDDVAAALGITQKTGRSKGAISWPGN